MNSSKKLAAMAALAICAGVAGTGCMAQGADADDTTDEQAQAAAPVAEKTGTAHEACGGGFGWGGFGWGGCGLCGGGFGPLWGGWGFPFFGGCGWGGGWGAFGGCGCGGCGGW